MKNSIIIFISLLFCFETNGQSSFGSKSFSKPTLEPITLAAQSQTQANVEAFVKGNGGAVINAYRILFDDVNPPIDTLLYSPLNNILISWTPVSIWDAAIGLTPGVTYYAKVCASNIVGETCTNIAGLTMPSTANTAPDVTTNNATNVTTTTATLNGNVTNDGGETVTDRGFYYSMSGIPSTYVSSGSGTGAFSTGLTGLYAGQTYSFRAYATNSVSEKLGDILYFTTGIPSGSPSVTTTTATNVTVYSAVSGGNILHDGGSPILGRGICYSTNASVDTTDSKVIVGGTTGVFAVSMPNLYPNTTYYYRAYAYNINGVTYGTEYTFTTLNVSGLASVTTTAATNITTSTVTLAGNVTSDGGSAVSIRGVVYDIYPDPTTGESAGSGTGSYSINVANLTPGTTYYYRAFAVNGYGITYGAQYSFTTLNPIAIPTVATLEATAITTISGIAGLQIQYNGNSAITESGVCYSTSANPTIANSKSISGATTNGYYNVMLNPLSSATQYYYRAYATNAVGTGYGSILNFTTATPAETVLPTVTISGMTAAWVTYADVYGSNVTNDGGATVTSRGLVCNTSGSPNLYNYTSITANGTGTGVFSATLTNLNCGTTYYVRAYATNSVGTAYSNETTITTSSTALTHYYFKYSLMNKTINAPAGLPTKFIINNRDDAIYACTNDIYYTSGEYAGYGTEGAIAVGKQLFYYGSACRKVTSTMSYVLLIANSKYVVSITNGIVDYLQQCP